MAETLRFLVEVDTAKGEQNIKRVTDGFDGMGKSGKKAGDDMGRGLEEIAKKASTAASAF
jgi:hypothetical protein